MTCRQVWTTAAPGVRHSLIASNILSCRRPSIARLASTVDLGSRGKEHSPVGWKIVYWTLHIICPPVDTTGGKLDQLLGTLSAINYSNAVWQVRRPARLLLSYANFSGIEILRIARLFPNLWPVILNFDGSGPKYLWYLRHTH